MAKYFSLLILSLSAVATMASVIQTDQIQFSGAGCSGMHPSLENTNGERHLVLRFESLKVSLKGQQKEAKTQCNFSLPFEVSKFRSVKFSQPTIIGKANVAPRTTALLNFEFAWPDHRGPDFRVGYKSSRERVTEDFTETGDGTEIVFGCGESSELIGSTGALLQAGWLYEGALAEIEMSEVRLKIEDIACSQ